MFRQVILSKTIIVLALCLALLAGCSSKTPVPASPTAKPPASTATPTPTPTTTPVPKATEKPPAPTVLKLAYHASQGGPLSDGLQWWVDEVAKQSNNRVKIDIIWGGALGPSTQTLDMVQKTVAEMGVIVYAYFADALSYWNIVQSVPLAASNQVRAVEVMWKLYDEFPVFKQQYDNVNQTVLGLAPVDNYAFFSQRVAIRNLEAVSGKKVRAWGKYIPKWFTALGGVPVTMAATEVYDALSKGVIDIGIASFETGYRYQWHNVSKYCLMLPGGTTASYAISINKDIWNKLPAEVQKAMMTAGKEWHTKVGQGMQAVQDKMIADMKKAGLEINSLPESEGERWRNMPGPKEAAADWVNAMKDKAVAEKVMARFLELSGAK